MRRLGRRTPRIAATGSPGCLTVGRAVPSAPPVHVGGLQANGRRPRRHAPTVVTLDGHEDDGPGPLVERLADPAATPEDLAILAIDAARAQAASRAPRAARAGGPATPVRPRRDRGPGPSPRGGGRRGLGRHGPAGPRPRARAARAGAHGTPTRPRRRSRCLSGRCSACPTCWPPDSCSSSTSPSGPGAPRSAPPTSVSIRRASPRTTRSGGSGSSRSRPSIRSRRSSARRATRSRV